jgi:hypothetical protein
MQQVETESLAAPLIAKTRRQYEQQLAGKQSEFSKRESALRKAQTPSRRPAGKNDLNNSRVGVLGVICTTP